MCQEMLYTEQITNDDHIIFEQKVRLLENKVTEKKIRLGWDVPNLELKPYKNENQDEIRLKYENKDKEISLQCFKDNLAIELYKELGFEKIDETKIYYIIRNKYK